MNQPLLNAAAFVLAAAAAVTTFGGNAALARKQFATAEHIAAPGAQHVTVIGRRSAKA
jgi:hypothetical protein